MTHREAMIVLNLLSGIGPATVRQLLGLFAGPADILRESPARLQRVPGLGPKRAELLGNWRRHVDLDGELARCDHAGVQLVAVVEDAYPALLKEIPDPPLCLYVRGDLAALERLADRGLAIVGSRRTSLYGEGATETLAAAAAACGFVVVSGLARGIDTVAHRTVVNHEAVTVAVIAGGLGKITPVENLPLAERILELGGALVSEQPLMMSPDKRMFPMRNRIISGMTPGTLVVEAGHGSGSLITAELAVQQGRQVFAVPGRIDTPTAAGCHRLIQDGAKLVMSIDDIATEYSFLPGMQPRLPRNAPAPAPAPAATQGDLFGDSAGTGVAETAAPAGASPAAAAAEPEHTPMEQRIIDALLANHELDVDQLARETQAAMPLLLSALLMLELKRVVKALPGRSYTLWR